MKFPVPSASREIPLGDHPGAFGVRRKHHHHEGVDLYGSRTALVHAINDGVIIAIYQFTGANVGMPWWEDTYAMAVADDTGIWVYGEIQQPHCYKVGDHVKEGHYIAQLKQVLKVDKGRPMTMLHLERWKPFSAPHTFLWQLDQPRPDFLLDPTPLLLSITMTPITLWSRWMKNGKQEYVWEFNHIEDGHISTPLPTPKCPEHERIWQGKWQFEHAWLSKDVPGKVTRITQ